MNSEAAMENLRKVILLTSSLSEKSLSDLLKLFTISRFQQDDLLLHAGEYPTHLAFIEKGIFYSYYTNLQGVEIIRGIFVPGMFMLPLPAFLYRKPSFLSFRAISDCILFQAKYSDIQALSKKNTVIHNFIRLLIDKEWIINRELHDAGIHVYNHQSRYELFYSRYEHYINQIPVKLISSFLNIPMKQLEKLINKNYK